jgi:DNA-binding NarL/FixJ family response regulator
MKVHELERTPARIGIVLADDHDLVRGGLRAMLEMMPEVDVLGEARDGNELLARVDRVRPDLVITDISMPGLDGLAALVHIRERQPQLRVLVVSMYDSADFVRRAVANGASGYLTKQAAPRELREAVRAMAATGSYFSAAVARLILAGPRPGAGDDLTERQIEILTLLASGLSSKEIAYQLGLSSKTVDVHRGRIMERLDLRDVASLTRYAVRKGLIQP